MHCNCVRSFVINTKLSTNTRAITGVQEQSQSAETSHSKLSKSYAVQLYIMYNRKHHLTMFSAPQLSQISIISKFRSTKLDDIAEFVFYIGNAEPITWATFPPKVVRCLTQRALLALGHRLRALPLHRPVRVYRQNKDGCQNTVILLQMLSFENYLYLPS